MTQYNSKNVSHLSLNELYSKTEISNLDESINIPTEAEERSMIQFSFRNQDSNIETHAGF